MIAIFYNELMMEKYRKLVIWILGIVIGVISLLFIDYILPKKSISDEIVSFGKTMVTNNSKFSRNKVCVGYIFYTQKGFHFSTEKTLMQEHDVTIFHTRIFENIVGLKTNKRDYSDKLISGLNGVTFYLMIVLSLSSVISLLLIFFYKALPENGLQNIILFNSLILFYALYLIFIH